ncbi:hypothetical protein EJ03DRAFT_31093 [Teratosphaeria nubilosa]|uniref:Uncharacterized protein n=1 Tax=Teratosphaeria nubilosa TaxID=161662 RepID=A0A6G1LFA6_9PEZI|nr:hypothetical protein EJ03DRAFT_31093 [Teratosphaeria nubilosa]
MPEWMYCKVGILVSHPTLLHFTASSAAPYQEAAVPRSRHPKKPPLTETGPAYLPTTRARQTMRLTLPLLIAIALLTAKTRAGCTEKGSRACSDNGQMVIQCDDKLHGQAVKICRTSPYEMCGCKILKGALNCFDISNKVCGHQ